MSKLRFLEEMFECRQESSPVSERSGLSRLKSILMSKIFQRPLSHVSELPPKISQPRVT